ncbi:hypothetical protein [Paenibacillus sp. Marseille-Q4541]|uniref:hypothetical protein n=1 Tax=Paenibacillus sp. Marseille-Q4541 TaxID=2831522 RepID=UPI001BA51CFB|nr:hypothetical protein [Paenibacillus sp. Marseille-Q4541]
MNKYVGLKWMNKDGDRLAIYAFNQEDGVYLSRYEDSTHQFADSILTEEELAEEFNSQAFREKFFQYMVTL